MAELFKIPEEMVNSHLSYLDRVKLQVRQEMERSKIAMWKEQSAKSVFGTIDATMGRIMDSIQKQKNMTQVTTKQTLVLTIEELYRVVPSTKTLEGYNFKDLKELLVKLIEKIEERGGWEFVQYINNKPSYFVVRELTVKDVLAYTGKNDQHEEKTKEPPVKKNWKPTKMKETEMPEAAVREEPIMTAPNITFTKLPWET